MRFFIRRPSSVIGIHAWLNVCRKRILAFFVLLLFALAPDISFAQGTAAAIYRINCGGGDAAPFAADQYASIGSTASTGSVIDSSGVSNPAPQAVYQSVRYGNFSYVLPNLTPGASYTVRLHFCENYWTQAGGRSFNVAINGSPVLTNFDIFAAAGGQFKAVAKQFNAAADASGQITVGFSPGTAGQDHNPCVNGLEVLGGASAPSAPANLSAAGGNAQVALTWTGSVGADNYSVKRSQVSGGPYDTLATGVMGTTYTDGTATNDTVYYYVVTASDAAGESSLSNEASATPTSVIGQGIGLTGQYYANPNLGTLVLSRTDPYVAFDWGGGSPAPGMSGSNFSVRWTGQVQPRYSQAYTFFTDTDDGARLWVNGQLLVDNWGSIGEANGTVTLQAGLKYDLKMEYVQRDGSSSAQLSWSSQSQRREVVPQSQLYPSDTGAVPPIAPIHLSAGLNKNSIVSLSWTLYPGAFYYNVYRSTPKSGQEVLYQSGVTATSFLDSGASNNPNISTPLPFYYQVCPVTADVVSPKSNEASATPLTSWDPTNGGAGFTGSNGQLHPAPPTNLQGAYHHGRIFLTWSRSPDDNGNYTDIFYNVYRRDPYSSWFQMIATGLTAPGYVDTAITNGNTYQYYVTILNGNGQSGASTS